MKGKETNSSISPLYHAVASDFHSKGKETFTQKSNHLALSKLHKRQYPLNLTLDDSKISQNLKKKLNNTAEVPDFINEYVSNQNRLKFSAVPKIDTRNTFTSSFRDSYYLREKYVRDLHPPVSLNIPPISYDDIKCSKTYNNDSLVETSRIYKPSTIYFSNRSKMILYTHAPIFYSTPTSKPQPIKKINLNSDFLSFSLKKKTNEKKQENLKFNENLKKLKEIIKDPLIYEQ